MVPAAADGNTDPLPDDCAQPRGGATYAPLVRRAWSERKWEDATPVSQRQAKRIETHRHCARSSKAKRAMVRMSTRQRRQFRDHRQEQLALAQSDCIPGITVYSYGSQCIAIPAYIVACESGGSWSAYNSSGAASIYQLMPEWDRPWPVDSVEDKRIHHRIASRLWNGGSGSGNWVCA